MITLLTGAGNTQRTQVTPYERMKTHKDALVAKERAAIARDACPQRSQGHERNQMIVTITAYKRPELLARCLASIVAADLRPVIGVLVSLDHHSSQMSQNMAEVFWRYAGKLPSGTTLLHQGKRLGVANHPRAVFNT